MLCELIYMTEKVINIKVNTVACLESLIKSQDINEKEIIVERLALSLSRPKYDEGFWWPFDPLVIALFAIYIPKFNSLDWEALVNSKYYNVRLLLIMSKRFSKCESPIKGLFSKEEMSTSMKSILVSLYNVYINLPWARKETYLISKTFITFLLFCQVEKGPLKETVTHFNNIVKTCLEGTDWGDDKDYKQAKYYFNKYRPVYKKDIETFCAEQIKEVESFHIDTLVYEVIRKSKILSKSINQVINSKEFYITVQSLQNLFTLKEDSKSNIYSDKEIKEIIIKYISIYEKVNGDKPTKAIDYKRKDGNIIIHYLQDFSINDFIKEINQLEKIYELSTSESMIVVVKAKHGSLIEKIACAKNPKLNPEAAFYLITDSDIKIQELVANEKNIAKAISFLETQIKNNLISVSWKYSSREVKKSLFNDIFENEVLQRARQSSNSQFLKVLEKIWENINGNIMEVENTIITAITKAKKHDILWDKLQSNLKTILAYEGYELFKTQLLNTMKVSSEIYQERKEYLKRNQEKDFTKYLLEKLENQYKYWLEDKLLINDQLDNWRNDRLCLPDCYPIMKWQETLSRWQNIIRDIEDELKVFKEDYQS